MSPVRCRLRVKLGAHGTFHLTCAQNAQEAFQRLNEEILDLILMDLGLPDSDGWTSPVVMRRSDKVDSRHYSHGPLDRRGQNHRA